jgi:hypothetical protein
LNNRGRRFLDAEFILGVEPRQGGLVVPWFDLDRTDKVGWLTLTRETSVTGPPRDVTVMAARGSRSAVIVDLDADGDLDIVTNEFNARPMVLVSNLLRSGRSALNVKLIGTASNRSGLGAVEGDSGRTNLHEGERWKVGYLSQSRTVVFRPGDATTVDRVEVSWSGKTQTERGPISANSLIQVAEK